MSGAGVRVESRLPISERRWFRNLEMYFRPQQFNVRMLRDDINVGWGGFSLVVDMASIMNFFVLNIQTFGYVYSDE